MRQGLDEYSHRNGHVIKHQKAISEYWNSDFQISGLEISIRKNIHMNNPGLSKQLNSKKLTRFFKKILNFLKLFQIHYVPSFLSVDNELHNPQILLEIQFLYILSPDIL